MLAARSQRVLVRALPLVLRPSDVTSVPAPGKAGWIALRSSVSHVSRRVAHAAAACVPIAAGPGTVLKGNYVGVGYSPQTPNGYLGKIDLVGCEGKAPGLYVSPATLNDALGTGTLDLSTLSQVAGSSSEKLASKSFNHSFGDISCSGGAAASLSGTMGISVKPSLHASFSLFSLRSADFLVTGTATASLTIDANAGAKCSLTDYPLVTDYPIATFAGDIGPLPVVVVLRGELTADATVSASADATASVTANASVTGGVAYANGNYSPIHGSNATISPTTPTISGTADATATITPALQTLLYGVGGPELSVTTGLHLHADTTINPWWTLTVPFDVAASLDAPALDLKSKPLTIYSSTFPLGNAHGPFPGGSPTVSVTNPGDQAGAVGTAVRLQIQASDSDGGALSYSATGLPANLSISATTGLITGPPTTAGSSDVTVTAKDATGPSNSKTFHWTITTIGGGGTSVTAIAVGDTYSCVLANTSIDCWGANDFGGLGDGTAGGPDMCPGPCSTTPVLASEFSTATAIAPGGGTTCALVAGAVDCLGNNFAGTLGNGSTAASSLTPVAASGISDATAVAGGQANVCAVLAGGSVDCWGNNTYGQLGDGQSTGPDICNGSSCSRTPVAVTGISNATAIAVGNSYVCALLAGRGVDCWGYNDGGALGDGEPNNGHGVPNGPETCGNLPCSTIPIPVVGISSAVAITAGFDHACALLASGSIKCWGDNANGQLGDATTSLDATATPVTVTGITNASAVSAGEIDTCAVLWSGSVDCWGAGGGGELGNGTTTDSSVPVAVSGIANASSIAAGNFYACALLIGGSVDCWGLNDSGQLGDGTHTGPDTCGNTACSLTPVSVSRIP